MPPLKKQSFLLMPDGALDIWFPGSYNDLVMLINRQN